MLLLQLILAGDVVCRSFVIFHLICVLVPEFALIKVEKMISSFFDCQVSKEFDGVVKIIRDSVQLLVLPPDLSPVALQGFVCASYLCSGYV